MVRQWQELFFDNRLSGVDLEGNPDFVKLAGAYGIKGWRITRAQPRSTACSRRRWSATTGPASSRPR